MFTFLVNPSLTQASHTNTQIQIHKYTNTKIQHMAKLSQVEVSQGELVTHNGLESDDALHLADNLTLPPCTCSSMYLVGKLCTFPFPGILLSQAQSPAPYNIQWMSSIISSSSYAALPSLTLEKIIRICKYQHSAGLV